MTLLSQVGPGLNLGAGTSTPVMIVPAGVTADMVTVVVLGWATSVGGEVPPTITPYGAGWTTLVPPRTVNTLGYAVFSTTGRSAGDSLVFQFSATRLMSALDFYLSNCATPVAGAVTDRPSSSVVTNAAAMATTEGNELVIAVSLDRTAGANAVTPAGATQVGYLDNTSSSAGVWLGTVPAPAAAGSTAAAVLTYAGSATASGSALQIAFPTQLPPAPPVGLLAVRQAFAAALSTVSALTGYADPPGVMAPGGAWPLLANLTNDGLPPGVFSANWRVLVITGGTPEDALTFLDSWLPTIVAALLPLCWVNQVTPVNIPLPGGGGTLYGVELTTVRE